MKSNKNLDRRGEELRNLFFTDEGFGCYMNFDLKPGFAAPSDAFQVGQIFAYLATVDENMILVRAFVRGNDVCCWEWNGDGCLLVGKGNSFLLNTDCKKDYGWERPTVYPRWTRKASE